MGGWGNRHSHLMSHGLDVRVNRPGVFMDPGITHNPNSFSCSLNYELLTERIIIMEMTLLQELEKNCVEDFQTLPRLFSGIVSHCTKLSYESSKLGSGNF